MLIFWIKFLQFIWQFGFAGWFNSFFLGNTLSALDCSINVYAHDLDWVLNTSPLCVWSSLLVSLWIKLNTISLNLVNTLKSFFQALTFKSHVAGVTVELFVPYPDFSSSFWSSEVRFTVNTLRTFGKKEKFKSTWLDKTGQNIYSRSNREEDLSDCQHNTQKVRE